MKRILHLTLLRRWFLAILSGEKKAEYRAITPYWAKRLEGKTFDEVHFRNGSATDAPFMRVQWLGMTKGGHYAILLGDILETRNLNRIPEKV